MVGEIGDCPLCFGRLIPLSVCQSCNSVIAREGLEEVGPQITCEDCGATNATHFVCSACNARFPYQEIVKPEGPTCPVCKSPVPRGAELCPNCSAVLPLAGAPGARLRRRVHGEYGEEDVHEVGRIPGVGRQRAEVLCAAGYNALWKIARATEGQLGRIKGIGPRTAAQIKESLRFLLLVGRRKTKEEVLSEEYDCPLCGTVTSLFSTRCHDCGATFDEEELDEEFRREVEREEDKGLLAYYDVRLLEEPDNAALHYARGVLLLAVGRPADALASLDKVLELKPGDRRALQTKARALAGAKGTGAAAQVLHHVVTEAGPETPPRRPEARAEEEEAALAVLGGLAEVECPECGEKQPPGASVCPVCGHRFAPEALAPAPAEPAPEELEEDRLLDELERAVAGEAKAPPPPLKPEIPQEVVDKKRSMLSFLLKIPGVSRRAAEAASGFFQDLDQIGLSDASDLAEIPGMAPAEARLMKAAVDKYLAPAEEVPTPTPEARPVPPRPAPRPVPEVSPPEAVPPAARPPVPPTPRVPARPPAVLAAGRRGLINGRGLVNGRGRVNGLINGTGFVNGSAVAELRLPRRNLMPRYVAIGASLLMLFSFAAVLVPAGEPTPLIQVDGLVEDWDGVPGYAIGTVSDNANVTIALAAVRYVPTDGLLFARLQVVGQAFGDDTDYDTLYAFLDADGDAATGYDLGSMGADYVARVSGTAGRVEDTRLQRFEGSDTSNWNGWQPAGAVSAAARSSEVELSIPADSLDAFSATRFRVLFAFNDNEAATSRTEIPIGPSHGALRITQREITRTVGVGAGQPLLELLFVMEGGGAAAVQQVTLRTGPYGTYGVVPTNINVGSGQVRHVVAVDTTGLSQGTNVSAGVASVLADRPFAVFGVEARAFVTQAPPATEKRIDGMFFADWPSPLPDTTDTPPVDRRSLNILSRDGSVVGTEVFLYAHLGGPALEGSLVPERLRRIQQAPGGGGGGGAPGAPPPPLAGYDYVRFYVDTNESEPGGFDVNGLLVDRYVEVRGRGGRVVNGSVYRWSGSDWPWDGPASAGLGGLGADELEVSASMPTATFNVTRVVAVSGDWRGLADVVDPAGTRTRGYPLVVPMSDPPGVETAIAQPLSSAPSVDGLCTDSVYAESGLFDDPGIVGWVGTYQTFVYVCVDITADGDDDANDEGNIYFDTNHTGGGSPEVEDRKFRIISGGAFSQFKGDGAGGWEACGQACHSGNTGVGEFRTGPNRQVYEYKIRFVNVWGTDSPTANDRAGFAVRARDDSGGGVTTWGSTSPPSDTDPSTWGHLDIPEFEHVAAVSLVLVLVVFRVRTASRSQSRRAVARIRGTPSGRYL